MEGFKIRLILNVGIWMLFAFPTKGQIGDTLKIHQDLQIIPLSENVLVHQSWTVFSGFGKVASNGLIFLSDGEAIIMDTPVKEELSKELLDWMDAENHKVVGIIINHFHEDCLGGLTTFHERKIPSYATKRCLRLAKKTGKTIPKKGFRKKLNLKVGNQKVEARYFGKAHSYDNLVVYLPSEQTLFGGCMIKSLKAGKGNLADASVPQWSTTVQKIKDAYPNLKTVIPGHGKVGSVDLLDYTIEMFIKK